MHLVYGLVGGFVAVQGAGVCFIFYFFTQYLKLILAALDVNDTML